MESIVPEQILLLSAAAQVDLQRYAGALARRLGALTAGRQPASEVVADAAYTLQVGRSAMPHRLAVTAADPAVAVEALLAFADGRVTASVATGTATGPAADSVPHDPATPAEAVRAWLAGADIDWSTWWSARRSRLSLPTPARWTAPESEPAPEPAPVPAPEPEPDQQTVDTIAGYLVEWWAEASGLDPGTFDAHTQLEQIGLSSFLVTRMNARLRQDFGERDRTLFFSHGDLAGVAATLASRHPGRLAGRRPASAAGPALDTRVTPSPSTSASVSPSASASAGPDDRVAIIAMAGRLPGARTLAEYWENLRSGRDCVTRVPDDRVQPGWPADQMWGGFLEGVADFDPLLFAITPRDAELMDPQERLFLEVAWECLEDGGYSRARLRERHDGRVGVFVGAMHNEYPYFGVERSLTGPGARYRRHARRHRQPGLLLP